MDPLPMDSIAACQCLSEESYEEWTIYLGDQKYGGIIPNRLMIKKGAIPATILYDEDATIWERYLVVERLNVAIYTLKEDYDYVGSDHLCD